MASPSPELLPDPLDPRGSWSFVVRLGLGPLGFLSPPYRFSRGTLCAGVGGVWLRGGRRLHFSFAHLIFHPVPPYPGFSLSCYSRFLLTVEPFVALKYLLTFSSCVFDFSSCPFFLFRHFRFIGPLLFLTSLVPLSRPFFVPYRRVDHPSSSSFPLDHGL